MSQPQPESIGLRRRSINALKFVQKELLGVGENEDMDSEFKREKRFARYYQIAKWVLGIIGVGLLLSVLTAYDLFVFKPRATGNNGDTGPPPLKVRWHSLNDWASEKLVNRSISGPPYQDLTHFLERTKTSTCKYNSEEDAAAYVLHNNSLYYYSREHEKMIELALIVTLMKSASERDKFVSDFYCTFMYDWSPFFLTSSMLAGTSTNLPCLCVTSALEGQGEEILISPLINSRSKESVEVLGYSTFYSTTTSKQRVFEVPKFVQASWHNTSIASTSAGASRTSKQSLDTRTKCLFNYTEVGQSLVHESQLYLDMRSCFVLNELVHLMWTSLNRTNTNTH